MAATILDFSSERNDRNRIGQDWGLALEAFLNHCRAKNLTAVTINWYEEIVGKYLIAEFVEKNKIKSPQDFGKIEVDKFIVHAHKRGLSASTANVWLRAVRVFFNFLFENEYIDSKVKIKLLKADKTVIKAFSTEQVKKLIEKPKDPNVSFAEFRDWAMVNFLVGTGVRLSTLQDLRVGDIDFVERSIFLRHMKNREKTTIPLSIALAKVLQEYLKIRQGQKDDYLFCCSYGTRFEIRSIQGRIKEYCIDRLGSDDGMRNCCHDFRHTFALMAIRNGADILTVQKLLSHRSLDQTRRYINLLDSDIRAKFASCSPLDSISTAKGSGRKAIKMQ